METCDWRSGFTVKESLTRNYHHFNIFQVMRLLLTENERSHNQSHGSGSKLRSDEINSTIRISSNTGYDFAPSEVLKLDYQPQPDVPSTMSISSFSVAGRSGPLPEPHKDYLGNDGNAVADFLDIFNHRLNVMRFQIKMKANAGLEDTSPDNFFSSVLVKNIAGFGTDGLVERWPLKSRELMLFAGLLASKRKNVSVIRALISYYLNAGVEIEQFEETWFTINRDEQSHIGKGNHNNRLGKTTVLGTRCYDRHNQIRIICGPLDYPQFMELLPGGENYDQFRHLILFITDNDLNCTVELVLMKKDIPVSRLSATVHLGGDTELSFKLASKKSMMLGRNSWVNTKLSEDRNPISVKYLIRPEAYHADDDTLRTG